MDRERKIKYMKEQHQSTLDVLKSGDSQAALLMDITTTLSLIYMELMEIKVLLDNESESV